MGCRRSASARALIATARVDPAMTVRLHALGAAERRGDPKLARAAVPLARDLSGDVRVNAPEPLARMRIRGLRAILAAAIADPKDDVRREAERLLAQPRDGTARASSRTRKQVSRAVATKPSR